jgi:hypothetical protein
MTPRLKPKTKCPFESKQIVVALRTFAWEGGVVRQGEKFRGGDSAVVANFSAFADGETLPSELENPFEALPPPPEHAPPVHVWSTSIPVHRQVRCMVDASVPVQWTPDSPGARSGTPPPFIRSTLRAGQICDVLSDVVRKNPSWFRWDARDVSPEDIERMERNER